MAARFIFTFLEWQWINIAIVHNLSTLLWHIAALWIA
jgi:hypothetical protein